MRPGQAKIELMPSDKDDLERRLMFILDMINREHEHASTHRERNAYMHVIRVEIQALMSDLTIPASMIDQIPF